MKQAIAGLILFAALLFPLTAQGSNPPDGHDWNGMPESARLAFVMGWTESEVSLCARFIVFVHRKEYLQPCNLPEFRNPHTTIGDLVDEISRLYDDPRNRSIPLDLLTPIAEESLAGQSELKTKLALEKARELAAK